MTPLRRTFIRSYAVLSAAVSLTACVYIPPVWDINDAINDIESIRVAQTTRTEVLSLIGNNPSLCEGSSLQSSKWYHYSGTHSAGEVAYLREGERDSLGETPWYLNVSFDERGVVDSVNTNPPRTSGSLPSELVEERPCAPSIARAASDR